MVVRRWLGFSQLRGASFRGVPRAGRNFSYYLVISPSPLNFCKILILKGRAYADSAKILQLKDLEVKSCKRKS